MKLRLLSARPAVTRLNRRDARGGQLESVAAEFALLAQRRARLARQLDLLQRQLDAAAGSMSMVQARMGQLAQRMDQIDPGLRPAPDIQDFVQAASALQTARKTGGGVPAGPVYGARPADPANAASFLDARRRSKALADGRGLGGAYDAAVEAKPAPALRRPLPPRRRPFLPE
jgi:hypothetical protein